MSKNKPSWLDDVTNIEDKNIVEPFSKQYQPSLQQFQGKLAVIGKRTSGSNKVAYALRIEEDINEILNNECLGSKNALINLLLRYAIEDLKGKNITLSD